MGTCVRATYRDRGTAKGEGDRQRGGQGDNEGERQ